MSEELIAGETSPSYERNRTGILRYFSLKALHGSYSNKMLPFTYTIKGGEMFTDRRERSITRSTFENAYKKIKNAPDKITGPKALNMYGAP